MSTVPSMPIASLTRETNCRDEIPAARVASGRPDRIAGGLRLEVGFESSEQRRTALDWLSRGLRPEQPARLALEYPLLFARNASARPVFLYDENAPGTPSAACMLWAVTFRVGVESLRIGMISLVYTDPRARGRGHAQRVVRRAIEEGRKLGLGLVLLWSDLDALYSRLGFREVGADSLLILDRGVTDRALSSLADSSSPSDPTSRKIPLPQPRAALASDWLEIERIRGDRESQLQLDAHEWRRLRDIPEMALRVARDETGRMGFAIRGRGDDFREVIHEWGGDTRLCLACCRALMEDRLPDHQLFLLSPATRTDLTWSLRRAGARVVRRPMAWARIASPQALADDLNRLYPQLPDLHIESDCGVRDGDPQLSVGSSLGRVELSEQRFLLALLGAERPALADDARTQLAVAIPEPILEHWPLPLSVWGLESI